jgi:hypothetical protein
MNNYITKTFNKPKIILVGGGGHCKSCIDVIEQEAKFDIAGIIDMPEKQGQKILDYEFIGADVNSLYPQAILKAARFKGDKPVSFIDTRDFNSGLLNITDNLIDFIKKNIRLQFIISDKAERDERWEYPLVALREIILNALVHRKYDDPGNVQVRIFDNSVEIWSPGLLPKELEIETLVYNNRSIPRNKKILEIFHKAQVTGSIILTGFEPEIVLSSVRTVIEEYNNSLPDGMAGTQMTQMQQIHTDKNSEDLYDLRDQRSIPADYTITDTSWRVLKLILGNAGLSNKGWGINE